MKVTLLGTGTSSGVPVLGCNCKVCRSKDPRDNRLRAAAMVETESTRILIDAGPDIRQELLRVPFRRRRGAYYPYPLRPCGRYRRFARILCVW